MNEKKKIQKVSFLVDSLNISGGDRLFLQLINVFLDNRVETELFTCSFNKNRFFDIPQKLVVHSFETEWIRHYFLRFYHLFHIFLNLLLVFKFIMSPKNNKYPDLVVLHNIGFLAIPILKLFGYKVVYYLHFPVSIADKVCQQKSLLSRIYFKLYQLYEKFSLGIADLLLANSNFTINYSRKVIPQIDRRSRKDENYLNLLYPCADEKIPDYANFQIELELEDEQSSKIKNAIDNNQFIFTSISRYAPGKNLKLAVDSFYYLIQELKKSGNSDNSGQNQDHPKNPILIIIGSIFSNQEHYYREIVQQRDVLGLNDSVILLTSVSDTLLKYIISKTSCLLFTPIEEHFGIVPLEAMLFSVPTIALDSGGPKETVVNNKTGFLCQDNSHNYYLKMYQLFNDTDLCKQMGLNANERYYSTFSYARFSTNLINILSKRGFFI